MELSEKIYYSIMTLFFVGWACLALVTGCTDERTTTRVLQDQGYTNVKTDGLAWFSCGKGDWYATKFFATSPNGTSVEGAVCTGLLFKNSTIRFR